MPSHFDTWWHAQGREGELISLTPQMIFNGGLAAAAGVGSALDRLFSASGAVVVEGTENELNALIDARRRAYVEIVKLSERLT